MKIKIFILSTLILLTLIPVTQGQDYTIANIVSSGVVNIRSCASTQCEIAYRLNNGDEIKVVGEENDGDWVWYELDDGNYVRSDLAELSNACANDTFALSENEERGNSHLFPYRYCERAIVDDGVSMAIVNYRSLGKRYSADWSVYTAKEGYHFFQIEVAMWCEQDASGICEISLNQHFGIIADETIRGADWEINDSVDINLLPGTTSKTFRINFYVPEDDNYVILYDAWDKETYFEVGRRESYCLSDGNQYNHDDTIERDMLEYKCNNGNWEESNGG